MKSYVSNITINDVKQWELEGKNFKLFDVQLHPLTNSLIKRCCYISNVGFIPPYTKLPRSCKTFNNLQKEMFNSFKEIIGFIEVLK